MSSCSKKVFTTDDYKKYKKNLYDIQYYNSSRVTLVKSSTYGGVTKGKINSNLNTDIIEIGKTYGKLVTTVDGLLIVRFGDTDSASLVFGKENNGNKYILYTKSGVIGFEGEDYINISKDDVYLKVKVKRNNESSVRVIHNKRKNKIR